MTYNKFQMSKEHYINVRHSLPVSVIDIDYRKPPAPIKNRSHGHLSKILRSLCGVFISEEKNSNNSANHKHTVASTESKIKEDETQTLQDLENCANAARGTGACGQYEWIKSSDE